MDQKASRFVINVEKIVRFWNWIIVFFLNVAQDCQQKQFGLTEVRKLRFNIINSQFSWYSPQTRFEGEVRNGKKEGYGIYIDQNGNFFQGVWKNDKKEGFFVVKKISFTFCAFCCKLENSATLDFLDQVHKWWTVWRIFRKWQKKRWRNASLPWRIKSTWSFWDVIFTILVERISFSYLTESLLDNDTIYCQFHGEYLNDMRHGRGCYWTRTEYYTLQKVYPSFCFDSFLVFSFFFHFTNYDFVGHLYFISHRCFFGNITTEH
jgi:hypothetical protein